MSKPTTQEEVLQLLLEEGYNEVHELLPADKDGFVSIEGERCWEWASATAAILRNRVTREKFQFRSVECPLDDPRRPRIFLRKIE